MVNKYNNKHKHVIWSGAGRQGPHLMKLDMDKPQLQTIMLTQLLSLSTEFLHDMRPDMMREICKIQRMFFD